MTDYQSIQINSTLRSFTNSRYLQYVSRLLRALTDEVRTTLEMPQSDWTELQQQVDVLRDSVNQSRLMQQTAQLDELDRQRDSCVSVLLQAIRSYQNFPAQGKAAAALRLEPIARIYAGIQKSATETAQIEGLLVDLNKEQNKADITTLGLREVVTQLQQTNDQYKAIEQARASYKQSDDYLKSGRRARQLITPLLDELILLSNARAIIGPTDGLTLFIRTANTIWAEELTGYRIAHAQSGTNPADTDTEPGTDLTDPDDPAGTPNPDPDNHSTIGTGVVDAQ